MDDSDDALMERIKQRDSEALSELYHRFHVKVYSLARHVTHSRTLAQEVTQDTFMKVWNHAEHYQNRLGKFRSWLLVITHRCALDLLQHEYRKWGRLVTLKPGTKTGAKISALRLYRLADTDAEDEARWREIQSSMSRIPPEQREVIELNFYHGLSQRDIAQYLGVPLGTIKTRACLAINKLREVIQNS